MDANQSQLTVVTGASSGIGFELAKSSPRLVDLNVRSTVHLAKLALADMVARDAGRILFTSSVASTMPGSCRAVYNASKSRQGEGRGGLAEEQTPDRGRRCRPRFEEGGDAPQDGRTRTG